MSAVNVPECLEELKPAYAPGETVDAGNWAGQK